MRAWQVAYRGLMPDDYLLGLRPEDRARRYNFASVDPTLPQTVVAVEADAILGFATTAPGRDADTADQGEICALYVEPDVWGRGVGRALAAAARGNLCRLGFTQAMLWVVAGNARARQFYQADGWTPDGQHRVQQIWSVTVDTMRYRRVLGS